MLANAETLIQVLEDAKRLLSRPDNDFALSSWKDSQEACAEVDELISKVRSGNPGKSLDYKILFAPTGSLQDVSLSSGWSDEFLKLADLADQAIEQFFGS